MQWLDEGCHAPAELGLRVKELIGGLEYWRKEGGPVEGSQAQEAPMYWQARA